MREEPFGRVVRALHRLEDAALALLLLSLIALASLQIVLRNLFETGLPWSDPLLRILVLWTGLLGAVVASREGRQISVDALSRLLQGRAAEATRIAANGFAALVSGLLAVHSVRFVASEFEYGSGAFSGLPAWPFQIILPLAFGAVALRHLVACAAPLRAIGRGPPSS